MPQFELPHHKIIESALKNFNADFLYKNQISFGGGTRIALEIEEYRESVDVDFLCPNKSAYRAVREQVNNVSLGQLVHHEFVYEREIAFSRDAVRTFIKIDGVKVKLEFVCFDNYSLNVVSNGLFPVPYIDRESCFYTKLLANSDRKLSPPCKDVFDILAMSFAWGGIPSSAISKAEEHYGSAVLKDLKKALEDMITKPEYYKKLAEGMQMKPDYLSKIIDFEAKRVLDTLV